MEKLILIKNNKGLEVALSPIGAGIYYIKLNGEFMTLTPENVEHYNNGYYGKTIAPVPNRLDEGKISISGKEYLIDINEGLNSLHSGKKGICYSEFASKTIEDENAITVTFIIATTASEGTVPGNLEYKVIYKLLKEENTLELVFEGKSDEDTYLSMTNHAFFSLGEETLKNIKLQIPSDKIIETRKSDLIPLQEVDLPTCLDFNQSKDILFDINNPYIKDHRSNGIDHAFRLTANKVCLESRKYLMEIETDFKYLQIYSDNYEDDVKMFGTNNETYRGAAIEPEDSILHRETLSKNTLYKRYINYKFIVK